MFIFIPFVKVDAEDMTCNYASKALLNKVAGKVTASYEFKYDTNNNVSFNISIYNITEDIYVTVEKDGIPLIDINYNMTKNGMFTFNDRNTDTIIKYDFIIKPAKYNCIHDLRKITVTKPKRNNLSDLLICKYEEVQDYSYCQEWLTESIGISEEVAIQKIIEERKRRQPTTTSRCISCEIDTKNKTNAARVHLIKTYIIIGLSIGIVLDIALIIFLIRRIRRNSI